jgi:hypothetical protein
MKPQNWQPHIKKLLLVKVHLDARANIVKKGLDFVFLFLNVMHYFLFHFLCFAHIATMQKYA